MRYEDSSNSLRWSDFSNRDRFCFNATYVFYVFFSINSLCCESDQKNEERLQKIILLNHRPFFQEQDDR